MYMYLERKERQNHHINTAHESFFISLTAHLVTILC